MSGLLLGLTIAIAVIVLVGLMLGIIFKVLGQQMVQSGRRRIQDRFVSDPIVRSDTTANFFGLQSRGPGQMRGNGVLVLTAHELWFSRFVKRDDIEIPLSQIVTVALVQSHLGKRIFGQQLLHVTFRRADGQNEPSDTDAIAWAIADPMGWKNAIEDALPGR